MGIEYWIITASVPANAPAGTIVTATVQRSAVAPPQYTVFLPSGAIVQDVYVLSTSGLKTQLVVNKGTMSLPLGFIEDAVLISLNQRVKPSFALSPGEYTFSIKTNVAAGTSAVTVTWYMQVMTPD